MDPTAFLDEFQAEAGEHLRALDVRLLELERDPAAQQPLREMFLSAHTLKGGAAMLGLDAVRELAHAMEDVLAFLRDQRRPLDAETADLLFRVVDRLRELTASATPGVEQADAATAGLVAALRRRAGPAQAAAAQPPSVPGRGSTPRALLVELSSTVRGLETLLLQDAGFRVDALADGNEALTRALASRYDLLVTGIENRGLRGLDLAAALRRAYSHAELPIVVMSSDDNAEHRARAAELGVLEYIRKGSLGQRRLVEVVRQLTQPPAAAPLQAPPPPDEPPIDVRAARATRPRAAESRAADAGREQPRLLVVDDSGLSRRVLRATLAQLGYAADDAASGQEALDALARRRYAAVLMDCQMSGMDGFQTSAEIRRREGTASHTPIIAVSATLAPIDLERCSAAGMDGYVGKPVRVDELQQALVRWMPSSAAAARPTESQTRVTQAITTGQMEIDPAVLRNLADLLEGDGPSGLPEMIDLFLQESTARLGRVRLALERGDARELERAAHSIKGSAGTFGAHRVRELADRIEQAARGEALGEAAGLADELEDAFQRVRAELESLPGKAGPCAS